MIEYRGVSKTFADGTTAVGDFSLVIPSHSTTVFVGSSGCGKTTLLRMVNRMVDPSAGQVLIDDVDVATRNPIELRRSIGYVMQHAGLLPHRTVLENVATVLRLNGVDKAAAHERARDVLQTVGLDVALATRYPRQLSGGQQQRVGVARGLAADPNILLMDEPFGAVDPIVRAELQRELAPAPTRARQDDRVRHPRHRRGLPARRSGRHPQAGRRGRAGRNSGRDPREPGRRVRPQLRRPRSRPPHLARGGGGRPLGRHRRHRDEPWAS